MRSNFVISLDFELAWGVRDLDWYSTFADSIRRVPQVVDRTLALFEQTGTAATWATVGLLMCDSAEDAREQAPTLRPAYRRPELDPYRKLEVGGSAEREHALWFAPDLVRRMSSVPGQEVATHTFSHFYCREEGGTGDALIADLAAAAKVHRRHRLPFESIVFPRNQAAPVHIQSCAASGIRRFRGNPDTGLCPSQPRRATSLAFRLGRIIDDHVRLVRSPARPRKVSTLLDVPASRFLRPAGPNRALARIRVRRILNEMTRVAACGGTYHLWWHPHNFGADPHANAEMLRVILEHRQRLARRGMRSVTMADHEGCAQ